LRDEVERTRSALEAMLATCKAVTLSIDGWSDVSNNSVYAICLITDDGTSFLLDTLDLSGERHTAANLMCTP
jgi:hypothetical protein